MAGRDLIARADAEDIAATGAVPAAAASGADDGTETAGESG